MEQGQKQKGKRAQVIAIRDLAGLHLESIWQHVTDEP